MNIDSSSEKNGVSTGRPDDRAVTCHYATDFLVMAYYGSPLPFICGCWVSESNYCCLNSLAMTYAGVTAALKQEQLISIRVITFSIEPVT